MPRPPSYAGLALSLVAALMLHIGCAAHAQAPTKPIIAIPQQTFDFGKVMEGTKVEHEFTVSNKGTSDLLIQRVVAGCGCTAAAALNTAIAAAAESKITVSLDTVGMSGLQNKTVRVYSNDTDNPIMTLTLNGDVQQKVTVQPENILFESITRGQKEPASRDVKISTERGGNIKIGEIESFSKYVKIENISGDQYEKKFTIQLDSALPLGDFRERIIVSLSGASKSTINIPIYANVKGFLQLNPPALSFGIISGKEPITRQVTIENKSSLPYNLTAAVSSNKAVSAKINELKPGKSYSVDVTIDPKKIESDLRSEIKFKADTEIEESLTINLYGVLPPKI
jgi:hypothetical protein